MAFWSKLGHLVTRQSGLANSVPNSPLTVMFNSVRFASTTKLFIGGLSYNTDDQSLKDAFHSFGNVIEAKVITDRDSGRSRGFGFVDYDNEESAGAALKGMDGQALDGRNIRVSYANDRPTGGFQGGFGGFGGA